MHRRGTVAPYCRISSVCRSIRQLYYYCIIQTNVRRASCTATSPRRQINRGVRMCWRGSTQPAAHDDRREVGGVIGALAELAMLPARPAVSRGSRRGAGGRVVRITATDQLGVFLSDSSNRLVTGCGSSYPCSFQIKSLDKCRGTHGRVAPTSIPVPWLESKSFEKPSSIEPVRTSHERRRYRHCRLLRRRGTDSDRPSSHRRADASGWCRTRTTKNAC